MGVRDVEKLQLLLDGIARNLWDTELGWIYIHDRLNYVKT